MNLKLDLQDMDGILGSTFEMLIKETFRADKHFIIARMKSRHEASFTKQFSSFFCIYSVMKMIFKKKGAETISRFHPTCAISAKNPMTNHTIVGEVEFYVLKNIYLEKPAENRYPKDQSLSLVGVKGEFLGSDYSFAHSPSLQFQVTDNCPEDYKNLLTLDEYVHPLNDEWQVYLDRNVSDMQFSNDFQEIAVSAYRHSDKFFVHGIITCVYVLVAFDTFINGLNAAFAGLTREVVYPMTAAWLLPVLVLVYDSELKRIYKREEF